MGKRMGERSWPIGAGRHLSKSAAVAETTNCYKIFLFFRAVFCINLRRAAKNPIGMRHSHSQTLSDAQVARLEYRRKALGYSRGALLLRFEEALQRDGYVHSLASAKMRLDRVVNPYLRRPVSEATLLALAAALDWTLPELEAAIQPAESKVEGRLRVLQSAAG
jgi:hypothetical protein